MNKGKKAYLLTDNRETALEILVFVQVINFFFYDYIVTNVDLILHVVFAEYIKIATLIMAILMVIFSLALAVQIFIRPRISIKF